MHCEVNDFRDVAESKADYRVSAAVIDSDTACVRIMQGGTWKADIRHVTGAFVDGLRM